MSFSMGGLGSLTIILKPPCFPFPLLIDLIRESSYSAALAERKKNEMNFFNNRSGCMCMYHLNFISGGM